MEASRLRSAIVLLFALAMVAYGISIFSRPLTVDEFVRQIDQMEGEMVAVTGYLGECQVSHCMLYRNKRESDDFNHAIAAMRAKLEDGADISGSPFPDHPSVSIGSGSKSTIFELGVQSYKDGYVVIIGEATKRCRLKDVYCKDGEGEIEFSSVRSASAVF